MITQTFKCNFSVSCLKARHSSIWITNDSVPCSLASQLPKLAGGVTRAPFYPAKAPLSRFNHGWLYSCNTRSKHLEKINYVSPNARIRPLEKSWRGGGGGGNGSPPPPPPPPPPTLRLCFKIQIFNFRYLSRNNSSDEVLFTIQGGPKRMERHTSGNKDIKWLISMDGLSSPEKNDTKICHFG